MKRKIVLKSLISIVALLAVFAVPVSAAGLEVQKSDVITVLKELYSLSGGIRSYFDCGNYFWNCMPAI